ncbi:hypothetical protein ACFHW2_40900 [Actinomadura sp. LOL_016]|uniref:hypothetical protein n=1 Tax=unclassified Actinomadura TaxID=2626254 RepID=UPI003A81142A
MNDHVSTSRNTSADFAVDRYIRHATDAVMTGDTINGRKVVGFVYAPPIWVEVPSAAHDHVILEGEIDIPDRPLIDTGEAVNRCGALPPHHLPDKHVHDADVLETRLSKSITELTIQAADPVGEFFTQLFKEVADRGHLIWAVGGSVRDIMTNSSQINDLDFSGTMPPGHMASTVKDILDGIGMSHLPVKVSEGRVCSVQIDKDEALPLLEYKALTLKLFPFPASGGDLLADAGARDLTINSLYYDPDRRVLLDPTGHGIADLGGSVRVLRVPYRYADPWDQACILLRLMKFVARWGVRATNLDQSARWASALPDDLFNQIPNQHWPKLRKVHDYCLLGCSHEMRAEAAAAVGPMAIRLLGEIEERGGQGHAPSS